MSNLPAAPKGAWGTEGTSTKDLVIARIKLCQASGNAAKEGLAVPGQIIHSQTNECLAKKGERLEIIPILTMGAWHVNRPNGTQLDYVRAEALTPENDSDNWKIDMFDEEGKPLVKLKALSFLCLLPARLHGFPFWIDFTKTNKKGGKLLSTILQENGQLGKPAPSRVVAVSSTVRNFKNNSWFVYNVVPVRDSTAEELTASKKWWDLFTQGQVKPDSGEVGDDGVS